MTHTIKLLKITRNEHEELDEGFEETERVEVEKVAPEVVNGQSNVRFNGSSVSEFDAVFAEIPEKNAVFGRVLLEMIEEKGINVNYPSTAFFIMSKKNYLYHVLHEKDVKAPKTVSVASQKAGRNLEENLDFPAVARRLKDLEETEKTVVDDEDEAHDFLEGVEYPEEVILFHELSEGDRYRCLYTGGDIISLEDMSEGPWIGDDLQYSSLPSGMEETVEHAANAIGTPVAEVLVRNGEVVDVNPNPDLEMYTDISGKDAHEAVTEVLRGEGP
ncbi:MAG: RimK family alpha-L-glutamate ligase [Candidatus Nanohaloarchaea archaeon]